MSYIHPRPYAYSYYHDFGAATEALVIRGPSGKRGSIKEIEVEAIETFTNTTTEGFVRLGSGAAGYEYVNMGLGTLADGAQSRLTDVAADLVLDALPADTTVHLTLVAPTGGTPAGKAHVHVMIEWF